MTVGLGVGTSIPEFQARDQHGTLQTFQRLRGPRGLVMTFIRSADW
jgi:peroxiredoxin